MVEVKHDLGMLATELLSILYSTLSHVAEKSLVGVCTSALRYLEDNRRLGLNSSLNDSLELLHVVEVESRDSIAALDCSCKHIACVYKA